MLDFFPFCRVLYCILSGFLTFMTCQLDNDGLKAGQSHFLEEMFDSRECHLPVQLMGVVETSE